MYLNNLKFIAQYDFSTGKLSTLSNSLLFGSADGKTRSIEYAMDDQGRLFNTANRSREVVEYALDGKGRIWIWIPRFGVRIIDPDKLICIDSIPNGTRGLVPGNFNYIRFGGKDCMIFIGMRGVVVYDYKREESLLFDVSNGWSRQLDYYKGCCNNHLFISGRNQFEYFNLADFEKFSLKLQPLLNTITAGSNVVFTRSTYDKKIEIQLPYDQNSLTFSFSAPEFFFPERIEYAYQLSNAENAWQYTNSFNRKITYTQLSPGKYVFRLKAQILGGNWHVDTTEYAIVIHPAFWQTWWFRLLVTIILLSAVIFISKERINVIRKKAFQKAEHEKELIDLEAKALRAQMNPHFVFNCMNSIKSLIQKHEEERAITYLTTFSKLIRTLFNNADKKEISLYDEIETCKLYLQLESVRFDARFTYTVRIDETIDTKSVTIPAFVVQPFIENAIWHGIVPRDSNGHIDVVVQQIDGVVQIIIDDNGIGRLAAHQNRPASSLKHLSKGINLTRSRLDLDNLLKQRQANLEIIDKKNKNGSAAGTRVIIHFDEQLS